MRAVLLGDPSSGKTTVLRRLQEGGYTVLLEEGRDEIPQHIEHDKAASNRWFCQYYLDRDMPHWHDEAVMFEYCLHRQIPFAHAQARSGKISTTEADALEKEVTAMMAPLPLEGYLVIQFILPTDTIMKRQEARGRTQTEAHRQYWDVLREETAHFFDAQPCRFVQIDVTDMSENDVFEAVQSLVASGR